MEAINSNNDSNQSIPKIQKPKVVEVALQTSRENLTKQSFFAAQSIKPSPKQVKNINKVNFPDVAQKHMMMVPAQSNLKTKVSQMTIN